MKVDNVSMLRFLKKNFVPYQNLVDAAAESARIAGLALLRFSHKGSNKCRRSTCLGVQCNLNIKSFKKTKIGRKKCTLMMSPELVPKYTQSLAGSRSTVVSSLFSFPREMLLQLSLLLSMLQV